MNKSYFIFFVFLLIRVSLYAQIDINHWETVVVDSQEWKYYPAYSEPPSNWMAPTFADNNWDVGFGGFGFGDSDDHTIIDTVHSVYLRINFDIVDTSAINYAVLHADYDDAFIAYINGIEVARSNIGVVGDRPAFNAFPTYFHEARMYRGGKPEYFEINKDLIQQSISDGENILAIQVQNDGITSSDLTAKFFLSLGIKDNSQNYLPTPAWFEPPVFLTESNLPIIQINTNGQTIIDDPKIVAHMKIINQSGINHIDDLPNEYDGRIGIELRGSSSQRRFDKKSYGLETQLSNGDNNNVPLLGMPKENDWILYGPFSDKTLVRNDLVYHLARNMGNYAPRTAFCELLINDQYQGVYVWMEKIKRDANRVNINKLKPDENEGDDLTGGYIIKIDKTTGSGGEGWYSHLEPEAYQDRKVYFQYEYPDQEDITTPQKNYIQQYIHDFESALFSDNFKDPVEGYRKYIDAKSFIDFFIANELSYNVDGYRLSVFLHKEKDSDGGKLKMGPIWDFNLSIGNGWDCFVQNQEGFMYNYNEKCPESNAQIPFWWSRLLEDEAFSNELRCTWNNYRNSFLDTDSVLQYIDQQVDYLAEAKDRNFIRWAVLEIKVHFNFFLGGDYQSEVSYIKNWLQSRLNWLDQNMFGYCGTLSTEKSELQSTLYPNPTQNQITFEYYLPQDSRVNLVLYNAQGQTIKNIISDGLGQEGFLKFDISLEDLPHGIYFLGFYAINQTQTHKVIKY